MLRAVLKPVVSQGNRILFSVLQVRLSHHYRPLSNQVNSAVSSKSSPVILASLLQHFVLM